MLKTTLIALALCIAGAASASAHVTLEKAEASAGKAYKAILRVGHGCDGKPTTKIRVQIPEGVLSVKPMPTSGWTIEKAKGKYAKAYQLYGKPLAEGVTELVWSGGNLADDEYDEFVFRGVVASEIAAGTKVYLPVVQECTDGAVERWIDIPAAGKTSDDYETPAPFFEVVAPPRS
ncbi:YcnI family copper-binding membrane protein [Rhizobium mongolense]|uniref:Uncharacterized protein YcnI n=1 Tax=Rhizobium mongolense TaxID=57676 RepID=A0A7W6RV82_9HYPH|nr:DUF1775 domain-containing protein [Rhizobium mongolense]MBB4279265.1 uncharacterized protein YcnI [Rhizobium mongolense]